MSVVEWLPSSICTHTRTSVIVTCKLSTRSAFRSNTRVGEGATVTPSPEAEIRVSLKIDAQKPDIAQ
jgi:hypothetical protein